MEKQQTYRVVWRAALFGYVVVLGVGYVMGTKAGRRRYEQIVGTYRAVTGSPVARSVIEKGRRHIANRISPDSQLVTLTQIEDGLTVVEPAEGDDEPGGT